MDNLPTPRIIIQGAHILLHVKAIMQKQYWLFCFVHFMVYATHVLALWKTYRQGESLLEENQQRGHDVQVGRLNGSNVGRCPCA